jgi:hypothetical protein
MTRQRHEREIQDYERSYHFFKYEFGMLYGKRKSP